MARSEPVCKRIPSRQQQRRQPRLAAARIRASRPVLNAEERVVERDRKVAVVPAAEPGNERQAGERDADPEDAGERRHRRQPG
ncbi:MAG: hypothetical protein E6G64_04775 [Actinobacteria bacterium]|nr:MAG: hypothetical protein E6G64_04775 [Actinomycetota bacterium]